MFESHTKKFVSSAPHYFVLWTSEGYLMRWALQQTSLLCIPPAARQTKKDVIRISEESLLSVRWPCHLGGGGLPIWRLYTTIPLRAVLGCGDCSNGNRIVRRNNGPSQSEIEQECGKKKTMLSVYILAAWLPMCMRQLRPFTVLVTVFCRIDFRFMPLSNYLALFDVDFITHTCLAQVRLEWTAKCQSHMIAVICSWLKIRFIHTVIIILSCLLTTLQKHHWHVMTQLIICTVVSSRP